MSSKSRNIYQYEIYYLAHPTSYHKKDTILFPLAFCQFYVPNHTSL
ncbi:hypothetical protein pb186bvf_019955 [Paramecium bursaria]